MPELRLKKRGNTWYAHGTVAGDRVRQSLGTSDRGTAEELRAQLEARIWKRHTYGEEAVRTFEEAATSYMEQGGERRFLVPIITHFKGRNVASIHPGDVRNMALSVYPDASPQTRNRQAITPARAIINHAHSLGWCGHIRVELFATHKSRKHQPVNREWLDKFMAQADKDGLHHLSAAVLFMNQTGARRSEAVALCGEHVDLSRRMAILAKTKTDEWSVRHLTQELVLRIAALNPTDGERVFGYKLATSINRRMISVCKRAEIEYRSTHSAGRHSFGTNAMKVDGASIKAAMSAGGWKSAALFMQTYVHDDDGASELARKFDAETGLIGTDLTHAKKAK